MVTRDELGYSVGILNDYNRLKLLFKEAFVKFVTLCGGGNAVFFTTVFLKEADEFLSTLDNCLAKKIYEPKMSLEMKQQNKNVITLSEMKDKYIGVVGSELRNEFEHELNMELLGRMIKATRRFRNLTQLELGDRVGVGKAQISKWESSANNATVDTIVRVFTALGAEIGFSVTVGDSRMELLENNQK